jgi:hypothetical protein
MKLIRKMAKYSYSDWNGTIREGNSKNSNSYIDPVFIQPMVLNKSQHSEEPYNKKLLRTVLKPSGGE